MAVAYASPQTGPVWSEPAHTLEETKRRVRDLVAGYSIEVTPAVAAKHAALGALLPAGTRVYIAFVPGEDYRDVAATAARLRAEGLVPVPHFPARSLGDHAEVEDYLRRVTGDAGVEEALVIGGGIDVPRGAFSGTLALLETGLLERHGIKTIALAGHPEGQRELDAPGVAATLEQKLTFARQTTAGVRLVTQFLFEVAPLTLWERAIRAQGSTLPIDVGVPGPATVRSLLGYARMCGVGNSVRLLTCQAGNLLKLASLSYPDALITALAHHQAAEPETRIARLHVYPFGGLARTARWLEAVRAGAFTLSEDGLGFAVDAAAA
jgi:methylenetetrahydrofolate reductase (NADPH)